jgi:hypothetical protein
MPRSLPKLHLRQVERDLIGYLYRYKVATSHQIARDIYRGISHQALYKRLNLLSRGRLIRTSHHRELGGRLLYSLGDTGFTLIKRESGDPKLRKESQSASPLHDLDLLDIGRRLRSCSVVTDYWSENLIKSAQVSGQDGDVRMLSLLRPDAIVRIKTKETELALPLEYERSLKFASRYDSLFKKYYARESVPAVLYIVKDEDMLKQIQSLEKKFLGQRKPKFFYSLLENLQATGEPARFANLQNESIVLN